MQTCKTSARDNAYQRRCLHHHASCLQIIQVIHPCPGRPEKCAPCQDIADLWREIHNPSTMHSICAQSKHMAQFTELQLRNGLPMKAIQCLMPLRTDGKDRRHEPKIASILAFSRHTPISACDIACKFNRLNAARGPASSDVQFRARGPSWLMLPLCRDRAVSISPASALADLTHEARHARQHAALVHTCRLYASSCLFAHN